MPFIIAQFYPKFYTMIPAGLMVGFGGGPLWCAKCTYLSIIAESYGKLVGVATDIIVTRFFGVFFMFYQFSQVWGNLISSAVLSFGGDDATEKFFSNETSSNFTSVLGELIGNKTLKEFDANLCGSNFCPGEIIDANPNLKKPPTSKIYLISGIYLGCMIIACLAVAFGVDSLKR